MNTSIEFPLEFASADAIQRALYRLADRCTWNIASTADKWKIELIPNGTETNGELEGDFKKSVVDYGLREKIRNETEQVRNLLFAHAFSKIDH